MIRLHKNNSGFTLVELMLSMAFIGILLLAIALLVLQIGAVYNKGLTMRAVNESGQLIASDIQRTLNTSIPLSTEFVSDRTTVAPSPDDATGGRLCTGTTVYAWNYGKHLSDVDAFNERVNGSHDILFVNFDKGEGDVTDYCEPNPLNGEYPAVPNNATELLKNGDTNLAVHRFTVNGTTSSPGQEVYGDSSQKMYAISLTIGTNDDDFILDNGCTVPKSAVDDQYCGVNTFNFVARAGGR